MMADEKESQDNNKEGKKLTPEETLDARIMELTEKLKGLEMETKILEGRMTSRNPKVLASIKKENEILKKRIEKLSTASFALLNDAVKPRQQQESKIGMEALKEQAIEYFKGAGIDEALWIKIES